MSPKTARAAIYARFSTDKQRDTSVEDQFRVCRQRAESLGLTIVARHKDDAVSRVQHRSTVVRAACYCWQMRWQAASRCCCSRGLIACRGIPWNRSVSCAASSIAVFVSSVCLMDTIRIPASRARSTAACAA